MVSNESIRRWVLKFGPIIAKNLHAIRPKPHSRWHLDEMVVSIAGRQMYMWRAVDSEGEVLEILVQPQRDKVAAFAAAAETAAADIAGTAAVADTPASGWQAPGSGWAPARTAP